MGQEIDRETERHGRLPKRSKLLISLFSFYTRRYVRRHFHAVRVWDSGVKPAGIAGPLIVYLNHPSWWDPLICLLVARHYLADRKHYAPMDAAELKRYRFFSKLGFFGVEPDSRRGAVALLRIGGAILKQPEAALWITPQGRFADPRERPVELRPGLAHLARRVGQCTLLPLALEYPFGEEKLPEVLIRIGEPANAADFTTEGPGDFDCVLSERLQAAQDALAALAIRREYSEFKVILRSKEGVGFFYDLWRRARALFRGERVRLGHGKEAG